eukprot:TRINITY_DN55288_c0_g1_i1.p1 TRINITY_DN55288_c0_g1~~TRINITY_DN55288_c0_g1_i1.p1  ORF type:complete len:284 (+),score=112.08 TRINITY_DN55288_c0_g1_i1:72-854(+)
MGRPKQPPAAGAAASPGAAAAHRGAPALAPTEAEVNALVHRLLQAVSPAAAKAFRRTEAVAIDDAAAVRFFGGRSLAELMAPLPAGHAAGAEDSASDSSASDSSGSSSSAAPAAAGAKRKASPKAALAKRKKAALRDEAFIKEKEKLAADGTGWDEEGRTAHWKPGGTGRSAKGSVDHFCRIDTKKVKFANASLKDNRYETLRREEEMEDEFSYKAHCDLIKTQGKGFTKAKNKKKKANYRAGVIDQTHSRSYKFDSDSD